MRGATAYRAFVVMFSGRIARASRRRASRPPSVHGAVDSVRMDQSPLPGGVASVFRFLFSGVPQWVQIGGVVLGVIAGIVLAVLAWRHRRRSRGGSPLARAATAWR